MNVIGRLLQSLYFLYAGLVFIAMMIPVLVFALLVSPAGALRGGNLIQRACRLWADLWFPLAGIFHKNIFEGAAEEAGTYIYVVNHISWLDAALVMKAFRKPLRPLGRAETGKVPVFGFIYSRVVVSVDRSSPAARQKSVRRLKSALRKGISVLVFPEGTFNETGEPLAPFFDGAFRIAIETATPLKPVLFLDTYDRMPYHKTLSLNPGRSRAVFLEEIPVAGMTAADIPALREKTRGLMADKLRAYGASWIEEPLR
jgi:1-acyl-sn-glycerol-3-phosphate acyltransferase